MKRVNWEVGDIIRINRFGYQHLGVYVGWRGFWGRNVVHNCKGGGVVLSSLAEFSGGSEVFIHQRATCNHSEREQIAQRAISLVGTEYDLINFNCEHAAYYAQTGNPVSPQLARYAVAGGLALALIGAYALMSDDA